MKYILLLIWILFFLGCAEKNSSAKQELKEKRLKEQDLIKFAPNWVKNSLKLDSLGVVGTAYKTTGGSNFQQTEAMANGKDLLRENIKKKVSIAVEKTLEDLYKKDEKEIDRVKVLEVAEKIGTHISLQSISGSKKRAVWFDIKENLYILVAIDADIVKDLAMTGTKILLSNSDEIFTMYKKHNGRDILKSHLDKNIYN